MPKEGVISRIRCRKALPSCNSLLYRTFLLFLKTKNFGHDFETAEPLLHGQRVDGGVEFAIKS